MGRAGVMLAALAIAGAAQAKKKPVVCFGCNPVEVDGLGIELREGLATLHELRGFRAVVLRVADSDSREWHRMLLEYTRGGGRLLVQTDEDSGPIGPIFDAFHVVRVTRGEREPRSRVVVLVIDRSGSMQGVKLELAKKAARETLDVLGKGDGIGVIGFDLNPFEVVRVQPASDVSRFESKIKTLAPAGGTDIYRGLERGYDMLNGVDADVKHLVLLTDGQSNRTGIYHLVEHASRRKITTSAIAIGRGSDRALLEQIAHLGNGQYYFTESAAALPRIVVGDLRKLPPAGRVARRPGTLVLTRDPTTLARRLGRGRITLWLGDSTLEHESWRKALVRVAK